MRVTQRMLTTAAKRCLESTSHHRMIQPSTTLTTYTTNATAYTIVIYTMQVLTYCKENGAYSGCECLAMQNRNTTNTGTIDQDSSEAVIEAALRLSSSLLGAAQLEEMYPTDPAAYYRDQSDDAQWRVML
jgi:hypothetical protein